MRPSWRPTVVVASAALGLVLAACGGAPAAVTPSPTPSTTALSVDGAEFEFLPAELTAPAGEIEVTLVNVGVIEHDFTIDELDAQIHADAGETSTGTFAATAGTYDFYCSVAGHRESGMVGTLTVD
jgi:nitrite reductase (NO-forming)